ncbi:MAG: transferrin-binding protein-like solute binding protein [Novosphingobium sp.]|nr:transferrin-binding protein-like solute binding protein [Novosphingobium sp.]
MRTYLLLAGTCLLAACGGGGDGGGVASTPPPATSGGGNNGEVAHSFSNPTQAKSYLGVGASHSYEYTTDGRECCNQQGELYAGNASTVRDSKIQITYDPRDAIYTLEVTDPNAGTGATVRFQDPASRTDFDGDLDPQWGTPHLENPNIEYLQSSEGNPLSRYRASGSGYVNYGSNTEIPTGQPGSSYSATSFFFLKPGAETQHVTYAGYVRNSLSWSEEAFGATQDDPGVILPVDQYKLERGAFAFGETTLNDNVPKSGTATYSGSMIGSMVVNPTIDGQVGSSVLPTYFQWIEGTASLSVDFSKSSIGLDLMGKVFAPQIDRFTGPAETIVTEGAQFTASGTGTINLVNFGGFKGAFDEAKFLNTTGETYNVNVAGSSIDGAFYGPKGEEAGGGFRIVGGNPDERVDILGAFVGTK